MCNRAIMGGLLMDFPQQDLSLSLLKQSLDLEILKNLKSINYCGNLGDPLLNTNLLKILEFFQSHAGQPDAFEQVVRTNGGMRSIDYWTRLGNFFKGKKGGVIFSVDGLKDTNHIYRRGVVWDKLWANINAYQQTGAPGTWEMLVFDHNKHQIPEIQDLCKKLNFRLVLKNPGGFLRREGKELPIPVIDQSGTFEYYIYPENYTGDYKETRPDNKFEIQQIKTLIATPSEYEIKLSKDTLITCKSVHHHNQSIFISATGHIFPCCFVAGSENNHPQIEFNQKLKQEFGSLDAFDLRRRTAKEIITDPKYVDFFQKGWTGQKKTLMCAKVCGTIDKTIDNTFSRLQK